MTTVNLSLTNEQLKWIDQAAAKLGFANRSEFARNLLRFVAHRKDLLENIQTFPFTPPSTTNRQEILRSFTKTGKYSQKFIADLEAGLKRSNHFKR